MRKHGISWFWTILCSPFAVMILYSFFSGPFTKYNFLDYIGCLTIVMLFFLPCILLIKFRISGKGLYCDKEGIVINFKEDKIFWEEIENIKLYSDKGKRTEIYPKDHLKEEIRDRLNRRRTRKYYSIEWEFISKGKKLHQEIMNQWEFYQKSKGIQVESSFSDNKYSNFWSIIFTVVMYIALIALELVNQ